MSYDEDFEGRGRTFSLPVILGGVALLAAVGIALFAYASVKTQGTKVSLLETDVRELEGRLESFRLADKELKGRVQGAEGKLRQKDAGQAPLAAKILKSVFTVETDDGLGAGFVGWSNDGGTYVVTAAHVVSEVGEQVTLVRNNGSWGADVVGIDKKRDLAVLRVSGRPVNATPLWQKPLRNRPRAGDQLLLVGSPFGLERHRHERRRQRRPTECDPDRRGREPRQLWRSRRRSARPRRRRARLWRRPEPELRCPDPPALRDSAQLLKPADYTPPRWRSRRSRTRTTSAARGPTPRPVRPSSPGPRRTATRSGPSLARAAEDVDRAVEAAKAAFEEWRLTPAPERGNVLFRFARLLEDQKDELTELMSREMGKVLAEAGGDVQEAIDMSIYMAGEGRRLFGQTTPSELRDKFQMSVRMPVGVVGAITPWNFPIAIPAWKLAPALVCGNTVVLKPAEDTPALAERFIELLGESGLPDGVVNLVHGYGEEAGERLVRHPDVPIITFTGSRETGVAVTKAAADHLKHVHLELGGKNAIIVLDDADLELAVEGIVWSAFGTSGQRCTAASRVIVHEAVYGELQKRLVERAEKMRIGPGWDPETDLGPVINQESLDKIHSYTGIGTDEGAKLLTGGEAATEGDLGKGFFYRPTIFADVDPQMRIAQEEIFGPTTALIPVKDFDEAIRVANGIRYGLSSSIFTRDVNKAFRAMRDLQTGITYINAGTTGAEVHLPFGGTKDTGNGHREAGQAALDVFTEWKSLYVDYSGKLQRAQIDNVE